MRRYSNLPQLETSFYKLPTLIRHIRSGRIRVPEFQRDYVWKQDEIKNLLDSILNGYPIGTPMLLNSSNPKLRAKKKDLWFPRVGHKNSSTDWVIDGFQRFSTIYGALTNGKIVIRNSNKWKTEVLEIMFDLEKYKFSQIPKRGLKKHQVHVNTFNTANEVLYKETRRRLDQYGGYELGERFVEARDAFRDYEIPILTIQDRPLDQLIVILERLAVGGRRNTQKQVDATTEWLLKCIGKS